MAKNTTNNKERETIKLTSVSIPEKNVRKISNGTIFFTLGINGVTIYNCKIVDGKNGKFISFPQTKGKDDKYYSIVYVALADSDQKKIVDKVEKIAGEKEKTPVPTDDGDELPFV